MFFASNLNRPEKMNVTEGPSPSRATFVFLVPVSYELALLYAAASYFVGN